MKKQKKVLNFPAIIGSKIWQEIYRKACNNDENCGLYYDYKGIVLTGVNEEVYISSDGDVERFYHCKRKPVMNQAYIQELLKPYFVAYDTIDKKDILFVTDEQRKLECLRDSLYAIFDQKTDIEDRRRISDIDSDVNSAIFRIKSLVKYYEDKLTMKKKDK